MIKTLRKNTPNGPETCMRLFFQRRSTLRATTGVTLACSSSVSIKRSRPSPGSRKFEASAAFSAWSFPRGSRPAMRIVHSVPTTPVAEKMTAATPPSSCQMAMRPTNSGRETTQTM